MKTFSLFHCLGLVVPASTSWYLADLGEFRSKRTLYTRQSPKRMKPLLATQKGETIECIGRSQGALWRKRG